MTGPHLALTALDWTIAGAYGAIVLGVGWWASRRQRSADDYLLGGKRLPWFLLAASLLATSFSSISLLSLTGWGYTGGFKWTQLWIGELIAAVVVVLLFLPFFARLPITTAYEFLERRFGRRARWLGSGIFHAVTLARAGLLLFLTAQAVAVFTGLGLGPSMLVVGAVAISYSAAGGLGAVVYTDALQLLFIVVGLFGCFHLLLGQMPGGLDTVLATGGPWFDPDPGLGAWPTGLSGAVAYGVLVLSVAGTNQQSVQRYLACKDLAASRRAVLLQWGLGAGVALLTLGLGVAIHARFGADFAASDQVFATFVAEHVPAGLAGVLLAAIFAAAMSSIDSAIHALATATLVDFVEPGRAQALGERARLRLARVLTIAYGLAAVAAAFVASRGEADVLSMLIDLLKLFAGPVLGLFLCGMLFRRVSERHVLVGVVAGFVVAVGFGGFPAGFGPDPADFEPWHAAMGVHGIWGATASLLATLGTALVASFIWPGRPITSPSP